MSDTTGAASAASLPMSFATDAFVWAVNHAISRSPWATERLVPFSGSNIRLDVSPIVVTFAIDSHGQLGTAVEGVEPEVTLAMPASDLPRALLAGEMSGVMNSVRIEGNAELADALGFVFRNLSWDVEEDLSRVVGDIPAHRLVGVAHSLRKAHERALESIRGNLAEYVIEEQKLLLGRAEANGLQRELLSLRDDVARLEKRIQRVVRRRTTGT